MIVASYIDLTRGNKNKWLQTNKYKNPNKYDEESDNVETLTQQAPFKSV